MKPHSREELIISWVVQSLEAAAYLSERARIPQQWFAEIGMTADGLLVTLPTGDQYLLRVAYQGRDDSVRSAYETNDRLSRSVRARVFRAFDDQAVPPKA